MTHSDRDALLDAALIHVPFEGMNMAALRAGARDIGMDAALIPVHFPRKGADLAAAYHRRADAALRDLLATDPPQGRFRDRVAESVWARLELVDPELVRAGAAILALPQNAALAARLVWESADVIWTGLGDSSDDVNWYSKRATLSAVISATVLFWLGDDSQGKVDTREFLNRRIDGVMRFEGVKARLSRLPGAAALAQGAFGWVRAPRSHPLPGKTR
ncbi:COQ9 family protein [Paracoccus sp. 1_MG-2023]|uniref:COQ9 family protein n=1 Tax=unclassified Paracoccus (in: a-proteobacteria) TaxID=2688777 RepID=UPI001C09056B|nr:MULTISPECIES: COQ9 family protein [unclassified Paracoccus (in: a-proteobacteria)]MBU2956925.1 COQ9 family protein [Paracoccus sp. C2R09]MDO6668123.1 COQ9 family protein [Paracoccus sp. 1_MG-2023]